MRCVLNCRRHLTRLRPGTLHPREPPAERRVQGAACILWSSQNHAAPPTDGALPRALAEPGAGRPRAG
eukprot:859462-Alexandrium_andersonii.AAC.1